jgi:hypothetical protein
LGNEPVKDGKMRDLIVLLLFAISGYFIFHARAEGPVQETTFELTPLPDSPTPDDASAEKPKGAIDI